MDDPDCNRRPIRQALSTEDLVSSFFLLLLFHVCPLRLVRLLMMILEGSVKMVTHLILLLVDSKLPCFVRVAMEVPVMYGVFFIP